MTAEPRHDTRAPHRLPRPGRQAWLALVAILAVAILGCGGSATLVTTSSTPTSSTTSTPTLAIATTPPYPTATSAHAPAPTPTRTPVPPLQSQIILHAFNNVAAGSNSPIADMTCPSGYLVAGGGPNSGYASFTLMQDAPISSTTWRAEVFNTGSGAINVQMQVVCLKH